MRKRFGPRKTLAGLTAIAAAALVALAVVGSGAATSSGFGPGPYSPLGGTTLHASQIGSNSDNFNNGCDSDDQSQISGTEVLWHFVLVQTTAVNTGSLRAEFQNAGVTTPDVAKLKVSGGVIHWNVITPTSDTLLNASTDAVGAILNLSHVCGGGGGSGGQTSSIKTTVHLGQTDSGSATVVDNANPAPLGSYVHDSADLEFTGGGTLPSGSTVYFSYFTNNDCTAPPAATTSVDVSGESTGSGKLDPVLAEGPLGAGSYSYVAVFVSGDSSIVGDSLGDCEPFKVSKADLKIRTDIHDAAHTVITSAALGSVVHDTATLSGAVTGINPDLSKISFTFFTNGTCADSGASVSQDTAESTYVARTVDSAALGAGDYSYTASFAGDDNYNAVSLASTDCEPLKINKGDLKIRTDIHNAAHAVITSAGLGSVVHDTATLSDAVTGINPDLSKISFTFFTNNSCANTGSSVNQDTAESTYVARTVDSAALAAGDYSYTASFAGDNNYNAVSLAATDCEPLKINKGDLKIRTDIHNAAHAVITSAGLGSVVHDTATLSDAVTGFNPDLSKISFTFFTNKTCANTGSSVNQGTAEGTLVARTVDSAALAAGDYSYTASFAGDGNYNAVSLAATDCEPLKINKGDLQIRTDIHNAAHAVITSANAGSIVHDTATLSSAVTGFNPDLTKVSFRIYPNNSCASTGSAVSNSGSEGTYVARSANSAALAVGDFSYSASFAGDNNYNAVGPAACEPLHIFPAPLTIGYWKTHMHVCGARERQADSGCSANGPFTATYLGRTICSGANTCTVGMLGGATGYNATTEAAALGVFNANNCSNASTTDANAAACLAAQLLGAELNVANGANACVCATIAQANAALAAVKYKGPGQAITLAGSGYTRTDLVNLKTKLDTYNNGGGCP